MILLLFLCCNIRLVVIHIVYVWCMFILLFSFSNLKHLIFFFVNLNRMKLNSQFWLSHILHVLNCIQMCFCWKELIFLFYIFLAFKFYQKFTHTLTGYCIFSISYVNAQSCFLVLNACIFPHCLFTTEAHFLSSACLLISCV